MPVLMTLKFYALENEITILLDGTLLVKIVWKL